MQKLTGFYKWQTTATKIIPLELLLNIVLHMIRRNPFFRSPWHLMPSDTAIPFLSGAFMCILGVSGASVAPAGKDDE